MNTPLSSAAIMAATLSGRLSKQSRLINLLLTEASQHMHWLLNDLDLISKGRKGEKPLQLFDKLHAAEKLLAEFVDESQSYFPESKTFWQSNAESTDAFTHAIEALTGIDWEGNPANKYSLVAVFPDEAQELEAYLKKREKVRRHAKEIEQSDLFKGTAAMTWGGWNAIHVCCYKDGGREWRKFKSLKEAGKSLGLSATKIERAMENGVEYQGWNFVSDIKFEELKANHKIVC